MRFAVYKLPMLIYMGIIFYFSSGPVTSVPVRWMSDYFLHGAAYCVLYILAFWAIHEGLSRIENRGGYWLPLLITALYGISDEWHQSFVESRHASILDATADFVGGLVGVCLVVLISRLARISHQVS
jgi:VanZ family protein